MNRHISEYFIIAISGLCVVFMFFIVIYGVIKIIEREFQQPEILATSTTQFQSLGNCYTFEDLSEIIGKEQEEWVKRYVPNN